MESRSSLAFLEELLTLADGITPTRASESLPTLEADLAAAAAANGLPLAGWTPAAADYARGLLSFLLERRSKGLPAWPA